LGRLGPDGVKARYMLAACFALLPLTELVQGYAATICGIMLCVELGTALVRYSPLYELYYYLFPEKAKVKDQ
jgi:hypothetical protein